MCFMGVFWTRIMWPFKLYDQMGMHLFIANGSLFLNSFNVGVQEREKKKRMRKLQENMIK